MSFYTLLILTYNNLNDKLILFLNSKISALIPVILVLDSIFDYKKFYIIFTLVFLYNKFLLKNRTTVTKKIIFEYYYYLSINFFTSGLIVISLKCLVNAIRPFCKNILSNPEIVNKITSTLHCDQSFPSGHTSFVVIFALVTQKYCNNFFKIVLAMLVVIVSISRIMVGAHSIIDIVGAVIISYMIVTINHKIFSQFTSSFYDKYQKYFFNLL